MSDEKKSKSQAESSSTADASVKSQIDRENEQGFRGVKVDETPNSAYTAQGVAAGEETPESDRSFPGLSKDNAK